MESCPTASCVGVAASAIVALEVVAGDSAFVHGPANPTLAAWAVSLHRYALIRGGDVRASDRTRGAPRRHDHDRVRSTAVSACCPGDGEAVDSKPGAMDRCDPRPPLYASTLGSLTVWANPGPDTQPSSLMSSADATAMRSEPAPIASSQRAEKGSRSPVLLATPWRASRCRLRRRPPRHRFPRMWLGRARD